MSKKLPSTISLRVVVVRKRYCNKVVSFFTSKCHSRSPHLIIDYLLKGEWKDLESKGKFTLGGCNL